MRKKFIFSTTNPIDKKDFVNRIILNIAKQNKQIIYGARSIQAQNNLFARDTSDWDILAKNPKKTANLVQKELDNLMGFDYYYTQEAMHKGTYKVKNVGQDLKKGTEDDESIADYTEMPKPAPPFVLINNIRFRKLKEEIKAKEKSVADPEFEFRHAKDKDDINRIKGFLKVKRLINGGNGY